MRLFQSSCALGVVGDPWGLSWVLKLAKIGARSSRRRYIVGTMDEEVQSSSSENTTSQDWHVMSYAAPDRTSVGPSRVLGGFSVATEGLADLSEGVIVAAPEAAQPEAVTVAMLGCRYGVEVSAAVDSVDDL